MPDDVLPILERIRQNLLEVVGGITPDAGYQCTVLVDEPNRLGELVGDGVRVAATLTLGLAQWNPEIQCNNLKEWVQEFLISFECAPPEAADPAAQLSADRLRIIAQCDIEKAIDADPHRGGLAANTIV